MDTREISQNGSKAEAPPTEVVPRAKRRRFSASYKLRILDEVDACTTPGGIGALLRREGLYSSQLSQWRKQHKRGTLYGSTQVAKDLVAKDETITELRTELRQLRSRLKKAETVIDVQKKVCKLFGISNQADDAVL